MFFVKHYERVEILQIYEEHILIRKHVIHPLTALFVL